MMGRHLLILAMLVITLLMPASAVFAQGESAIRSVKPIPVDYQINIPGISDEDQIVYGPARGCPVDHVCIRTIDTYINAVYRWSVSAAIIIAIVLMMIGGIEYMIGSAVGTIERAKGRIKNASIGLLLLVSTSAILSFVNPTITQFKALELPAIETVFLQSEDTDKDNEDKDPGNPSQVGPPPVIDTNEPTVVQPVASGASVLAAGVRSSKQVRVDELVSVPNVPYYSQRDYTQEYGGCSTIKAAGCGPTSTAMILSHYQISADPLTVANAFAGDGYRACPRDKEGELICGSCNGTSWAAFTSSSIITNNNLSGRKIDAINKDEILTLLAEGKPLVASVGCSRFTRFGHFIVLKGINTDGTIAVNDPNSASRTKTTASELWDEVYISPDGTRDCTQKGNRSPLKATWLIEPKE